jgi:hypothetical protein
VALVESSLGYGGLVLFYIEGWSARLAQVMGVTRVFWRYNHPAKELKSDRGKAI